MTRNLTIAARLREVLLDGRWIANTNYGNVLKLLFFIKVTVLSFKINTFNITMYEIRAVYGSPEAVLGPQTGLKCSC